MFLYKWRILFSDIADRNQTWGYGKIRLWILRKVTVISTVRSFRTNRILFQAQKHQFLNPILLCKSNVFPWYLVGSNHTHSYGKTLIRRTGWIDLDGIFWKFGTLKIRREGSMSKIYHSNPLLQIYCFRLRSWWKKPDF